MASRTDTNKPIPSAARWDRIFSPATLKPAALGQLLCWASLPPLGLWPLAWLAPIFWLRLVQYEQLPGRRPYRTLWLVGVGGWLVIMQGMRLAHWATYFGWLALALYLGVYLPLFIALTRVACHRMRVPLVLAAPVVWTGLEYARGYMLTGFSMALLGHSQYRQTMLIQIADLAGAYAVSFVVMWVAACLAEAWPAKHPPETLRRLRPGFLLLAVLLPAASLIYGHFALHRAAAVQTLAPTRVALVQGWIGTRFDVDPNVQCEKFYRQYRGLSEEAVWNDPTIDLLIWPESMFPYQCVTFDPSPAVPAEFEGSVETFAERLQRAEEFFEKAARYTVRYPIDDETTPLVDRTMLVGTGAMHAGADDQKRYNTALLLGPEGKILARYDKMHPVMFGEYVPMGNWFPWIYRFMPFGSGIVPGREPVLMPVDTLRIVPSICFENTVPHLVRRQVVDLQRRGERPNTLVTVTNDGWFWESSVLDLHLICGQFRAIENRMPMLIAANAGFSARIDPSGRIEPLGPRGEPAVLVVDVTPPAEPTSFYQRYGDWPAAVCLFFCVVAALVGLRRGKQ